MKELLLKALAWVSVVAVAAGIVALAWATFYLGEH